MSIDPIAWCKDRMLVMGQPLSASLLFVGNRHQDKVLVIRTLISEISAITDLGDERALAEAKLNWWREALIEKRPHPVLKALQDTGLVTPELVQEVMVLIEAIHESMDNPRFETRQQAWSVADSLGGQAAQIEVAALSEVNPLAENMQAVRSLGAAHYWSRQIRDLVIDARAGRWFVPLDLQADYQITRADVVAGQAGPSWSGLVRSLAMMALDSLADAEKVLLETPQPATHHVLVMSSLDRRLLKKLMARPERIYKSRILPSHSGNVWAAWRKARSLKV